MTTIDYGKPPAHGWAPIVIELYVSNIETSYQFWSTILRFKIAYQRPEENFMYLENEDGAQVMLYQPEDNTHASESTATPCMLQIFVTSLSPILRAVKTTNTPLDRGPEEVWRRWGDRLGGKREIRLRDPDGHRVLVAEDIGEKNL